MEYIFEEMAMVHSEENKGSQKIKIISQKDNDGKWKFKAITAKGIKCTAIFNPFSGLYYADDIYGKIES